MNPSNEQPLSLLSKYSLQFQDNKFITSLAIAFLLLLASLTANFFAGTYATEHASSSVSDIILSNIPVINVDEAFVYGPIIFWAIVSIYCLLDPRKIPFWLKTVALFAVTRALFVSLTHIGPFPDRINLDSFNYFSDINFFIFNSGADLFFSGHTGLPFLNALIFWKNKPLRIFCLVSSIFFGIIVLLGHLHYTIDVLAAFFITYTIYHMARKFFAEDYAKGFL
ncbi:MAG: phosphatase PAP2-related protein [Candidatus Paceibacterota bacterium]